jgi:two-component system phosphate regulon response regulator PhoB/two-component system alkaline phosphatase synthesis response regulator PhoP
MKKVLVIEDEEFLRKLIATKLVNSNYEVIEAVDSECGLKKIKDAKPDIVLLDLILPGMDGFTFLEKIKDDPETKEIPVIILSNLGQKEEIEKGLKLGAKDFLVKANLTPKDIIEKIKNIIGE